MNDKWKWHPFSQCIVWNLKFQVSHSVTDKGERSRCCCFWKQTIPVAEHTRYLSRTSQPLVVWKIQASNCGCVKKMTNIRYVAILFSLLLFFLAPSGDLITTLCHHRPAAQLLKFSLNPCYIHKSHWGAQRSMTEHTHPHPSLCYIANI